MQLLNGQNKMKSNVTQVFQSSQGKIEQFQFYFTFYNNDITERTDNHNMLLFSKSNQI